MAFGESKAGAMQEATGRQDSSLPMALVLRRAGRSLVLADEGAASRMIEQAAFWGRPISTVLSHPSR
jgi:6-phosphogluconolactonase/glucosamine-6-phosphate isomerase/deaminase